ncbi:hypothetical protein [Caldisalinibacter kiritimatiensis]|uniref:Lipoprotein n=1 Tax=Caldisalinibacter kiritimatiensis TaxID=1304284 RepID=R1CHE0_9FIRM|nr:hypothetical protein [Caldisalinibacter kiritimatiensis]EOD01710.1 hypothetical protein L21TH_0251 [Caldisalinibacter kiritimatiensis]
MRLKLLSILISLLMITGCLVKNNKTTNSNLIDGKNILTIEEIKNEYENSESKIVNIFQFKRNDTDYILIESQISSLANRFELVNLKTGDRDILPSEDYFIESYKIINENYIVLVANGKHSESALRSAPFEIHCKRNTENVKSQYDFIAEYKEINFPINKKVALGSKEHEIIAKVTDTLNGIQIMFEPQEGYESIFYAGFLDIPPMETNYDEEKNQIIISFKNTKLSSNLYEQNQKDFKNNYYFSSVDFYEESGNSYVKISLKEPSKFFSIKTFNLFEGEYKIDNPCVEIRFTGSKEGNN